MVYQKYHANSTIMFVDDTSLFYSSENITDPFTVVNEELILIQEWLNVKNKMPLNVKKANLFYFIAHHKRKKFLFTSHC